MIRTIQLSATLFLSVLSILVTKAQNIEPAPSCNTIQPEFVKHFQAGTNPGTMLTIGVPAIAGIITWDFASGAVDCAAAFSAQSNASIQNIGGNIQLTFNTSPSKNVTISSTGNIAAGEYAFTLRLTYSASARVKPFRLIVRNPLDMVFVLDRSGSMECDVDESIAASWDGCKSFNNAAGDYRRWDILKESVDNFFTKLDPNHIIGGATGDQFSVVYFSGAAISGNITNDANEFEPIASFTLPLDAAGHTPVYQEMEGNPVWESMPLRLARDGTSLGEGMYKAINDRFNNTEDANRRQVILLFTDGEQNAGKWFDATGKIIQPNSSTASTLIDLNNAGIDGIQVFTAGLINVPAAETLLQNIADNHTAANPSYFSVLPGQEGDFESEVGVHAFNQIYNTSSPQTIRRDQISLPLNVGVQTKFQANKDVNRMIFEAHFDAPMAKRVKITVSKDGVDMTARASVFKQGEFITTIIFNLYDMADVPSDGVWTVTLMNADDRYQKSNASVYATADDHHVEFDGFLKDGRVHVGEKLRPNITLSAGGKPVVNAVAKALILKPGEDLGHILATTNVPNLPQGSKENGTCADLKLDYLQSNNPAALQRWKNLGSREIALIHVGNGRYEGVYDDVDVTGNYKIIYSITGTSADLGTIERQKNQTINVRFAPVNVNLDTRTISRTKDGIYYFKAGLKPSYTDPNGQKRYLGPGYEHAYTLKGARLFGVADNCDGSYELSFSSPKRDPDIRISVFDDNFYNGRATGIDDPYSPHKFHVSLHGGYANPFGDLDSLYDSGGFVEVDFGYRLNSFLDLEAVGGYYGFQKDYQITGGALFLKYHWSGLFSGTGGLFVGAGAGLYQPKAADLSFGYSFKAGLEKQIMPRLSALIEFAGVFPTKDLQFGTVGLGVQYHF